MMESITDKKISRRRFVGTAAVGAAALGALAGATALSPKISAAAPASSHGVEEGSPVRGPKAARAARGGPIPVPTNWSQTTDVAVIGYGGSGAISAITAYDEGANVLILEKTPSYASLGVTSSAPYVISGGGGCTCMNAGSANYVTDPIAAGDYIYQCGWGNTPMDVCQALAWMEVDTPAWLTKMGVVYTTSGTVTPEFPSLGGSNCAVNISLASGHAWFQQLDALVQKRGIPILFNTAATDLIQDPTTGEILGVQALTNNSEVVNVKANRAVILATGSFEYNEYLKSQYLRCYPTHGEGWQFNTGDSVTMASKVGAAMWHMGVQSMNMVAWFPEYPIAFGGASPSQHGYIYVDVYGNRWGDETQLGFTAHPWNFWLKLSDFDLNLPGYTRIPTFIIFDSTCYNAGAISSGSSGLLPTYLDNRPKWTNAMALANGWIQQGADIPTLVAAMNATTYVGVPPGTDNTGPSAAINVNITPATLQATLNTYNGYCAAGVDSEFGRPKSTLVPIVTPPFYSMPLWPGGPSLYGGPVRNAMSQICDADNNPIPRLYGVGENGSVIGGLLDVFSNNGQMIALGRVAGTNAAAENPWS